MLPDVLTATRRPSDPAAILSREPDLPTDTLVIPVKLCNLPPFHAIANQVLAMTADPEVGLNAISKVIEGDPAFAAEILFLANSSLFGFPSRMHVLRHAVAVLGLDRIKALAVTVAMRAFLGNRTPVVRQSWRHSAACALVCEELSAIYDFSPDRAYTAGIMHDIGRLGLIKSYPKEITPVLLAEHEDMQAVLRAEREVLQVDHAVAGSWLVKNWALPAPFWAICAHHHDAPQPADPELLQLVKVACAIADAIGFSAVRCRAQIGYDETIRTLAPRLGRKGVPPEQELRRNINARLSAFER